MQLTFKDNQLIIDLDEDQFYKLNRINQMWPALLPEYIEMIIKNRERQLLRIAVTREIAAKARAKKENE